MPGIHLDRIRLPDGFRIGLFAEGLPGARSLTMSPSGTVYVGSRGPGNVYALRDADGDGKAEEKRTVLSGLDTPNGVAWKDGALLVSDDRADAVYRIHYGR